jgi:hypothetical protein
LQSARTAAAFQQAYNGGNYALALSMVDSSALSSSAKSKFESLFQSFPDRPNYARVKVKFAVYQQTALDWILGRFEGGISKVVVSRGATSTTFHFVVKGSRIVMSDDTKMSLAFSSP